MSELRKVNVDELEWAGWRLREGIGVEAKDPARLLGSEICGFRLERLAPGDQASQLHRHHFQEELFLILSGSGVLRHGGEIVDVREGDFILYRAGDDSPHTFVNTGRVPLVFVATGNRVPHEVCEYPEEGTVFVEALGGDLPNQLVEGNQARVESWYEAGQSKKQGT